MGPKKRDETHLTVIASFRGAGKGGMAWASVPAPRRADVDFKNIVLAVPVIPPGTAQCYCCWYWYDEYGYCSTSSTLGKAVHVYRDVPVPGPCCRLSGPSSLGLKSTPIRKHGQNGSEHVPRDPEHRVPSGWVRTCRSCRCTPAPVSKLRPRAMTRREGGQPPRPGPRASASASLAGPGPATHSAAALGPAHCELHWASLPHPGSESPPASYLLPPSSLTPGPGPCPRPCPCPLPLTPDP
eukprot:3074508-Rhodomonas_salina.2